MNSLEYLKNVLGIANPKAATATFEGAVFTAVTPGTAGNAITLNITIGNTPQIVIDAWNTVPANLNNQVGVVGGPATFTSANAALALTGGVDGDSSRDAELQEYLNLAVCYINSYMNRVLQAADHLDIYQEPKQFPALILKNWPINSVASITSKGILQNLADFKIYDTLGKIIQFQNYIQMPVDGTYVEIAYNAGYAPGNEPCWLVEAIAMTAANISSKKGGGGSAAAGTIRSESITGVYSVSYFSPSELSQTASASPTSSGFGVIPTATILVLDAYKNRLI